MLQKYTHPNLAGQGDPLVLAAILVSEEILTMRMNTLAALTLAATFAAGTAFAQSDNQDARKVAESQAKIDHKADKEAAKLSSGADKKAYKAQAHADKHTAKALGTHEAKKAAKEQDKANAKADAAGLPQ